MSAALIPHPAHSPHSPVVTVREIMLACACLDLKATVMHQAEQITRLQQRNHALTKALHRTACAG
jgi:hypothetical protein